MRLIDCFIELIGYVAYFSETAAVKQPPFARVKTDIEKLITASQNKLQPGRMSPDDFDLARFAIFAWIDEMIMNSSWAEKNRWQGEQLQRVHYQTADAGELFFEKLNSLSPQQNEVREIYYLCLAMGFTGRFCTDGDDILLDQLISSNLKMISKAGCDIPSLTEKKIFPESYARRSESLANGKSGRKFSLGLLAGICLPVLLYGTLFFIFQFVLTNVGANFIATVP